MTTTPEKKVLRLRNMEGKGSRLTDPPTAGAVEAPPLPEDPVSYQPPEALVLDSKQLMIAWAVAAGLFAVGLLISITTCLISIGVALAIASVLTPAVHFLIKRKVPYIHSAAAVYAGMMVLLILSILVYLPMWQKQSEIFGARMLGLTTSLTHIAEKPSASPKPSQAPADKSAETPKPTEPAKAIETASPPVIDATVPAPATDAAQVAAAKPMETTTETPPVPTTEEVKETPAVSTADIQQASVKSASWLNEKMQQFVDGLGRYGRAVVNKRVAVFFQLSLLIGVFFSVPILVPLGNRIQNAEAPKGFSALLNVGGVSFLKVTTVLGKFLFCHTASALLLSIASAIALRIISIDLFIFIAGCVFVVSLISRGGPIAAALLALTALPGSTEKVSLGIGIAIVTAVLFFLEKKIHWYVVLLPALKSGSISPEVADDGEEPRRKSSLIFTLIRWGLSIAVILAAIHFGQIFYKMYSKDQAQDAAVRDAQSQLSALTPVASENAKPPSQQQIDQTVKTFENLLVSYPGDRDAISGMMKSYFYASNWPEVLKAADKLAQWKRPVRKTSSWVDSAYEQMMSNSRRKFTDYPAEGYEFIVTQQGFSSDVAALAGLGDKLLALDKESAHGCMSMARSRILENKPDEAIEFANRGLVANNKLPGLHVCLAKAYLLKGDTKSALKESLAEATNDPNNKDLTSLSMEINAKMRQTPQDPVVAPPSAK